MDRQHKTVCHSVGEYVKAQAHTNGIESFWALMKRGYTGTYNKMSPKHLIPICKRVWRTVQQPTAGYDRANGGNRESHAGKEVDLQEPDC